MPDNFSHTTLDDILQSSKDNEDHETDRKAEESSLFGINVAREERQKRLQNQSTHQDENPDFLDEPLEDLEDEKNKIQIESIVKPKKIRVRRKLSFYIKRPHVTLVILFLLGVFVGHFCFGPLSFQPSSRSLWSSSQEEFWYHNLSVQNKGMVGAKHCSSSGIFDVPEAHRQACLMWVN